MTSNEQLRAAADLRRRAAGEAGDRGGDAAYAAYRAQVPGVGTARRVPTSTVLLANTEIRDGKELIHTSGFFCRYGVAYPMWDAFGEYHERVRTGAGRKTIASKPDVAFLVNHGGVTMARTTNGTLTLDEQRDGGHHDAWLNPKRQDVSDLVVAIQDEHVTQMSFAFMIPDGEGEWSEDFTEFEIRAYDLDRGDVSAVNYGASPYTDISARSAEILQDLDRLPDGAAREAAGRLVRRGFGQPDKGAPIYVRGPVERGERVEPAVPSNGRASSGRKRMSGRVDRTASRLLDLAVERGMSPSELITARLPWYEIRNLDGDPQGPGDEEGVATVFVFDEIGGSMGVDAKTFATDLEDITAPDIKVRINSPGGSVFDGITIHSALLHHPSTVSTWVDGLAASAASIVMLGADPHDETTGRGGVHMMPGAQSMIHKASMPVDGNDDDLTKGATFLRRQSENLANMYAPRMGLSVDEVMAMMTEETWFFAQEAKDSGLADVVEQPRRGETPGDPAEERMRRSFDLTPFHYRFASRKAAGDPLALRMTVRARLREQEHPITMRSLGRNDDGSFTDAASDQRSAEERSTAPEAKGRSIALIEAQLAALEAEG